jgi:hypothetical protein
MDVLLKKLGIEKEKDFNRDFDYFYDLYKQKALDFGKKGELRFVKEHGKVVIFVVIEECEYPDSDESF